MPETIYDGSRPDCRHEVGHLMRLSRPSLGFKDTRTFEKKRGLPCRQELLLALHLQEQDSQMRRGLSANLAAWQHTRNRYRSGTALRPWGGSTLLSACERASDK